MDYRDNRPRPKRGSFFGADRGSSFNAYLQASPQKRGRPPLLAFGVAEERLVAAYWIEGWETYDMRSHCKDPDRLDQGPHSAAKRVGFKGRPATEYAGLIGKRLTDAPKGQNPISYLHTDGSPAKPHDAGPGWRANL